MAVIDFTRFVNPDSKLFDFNLKYLFYVGLWPHENWPKYKATLYTCYEISLHILTFAFIVLSTIGTYQNKDDILIVLANLDKSIVVYFFSLRAICFTYKRKDIAILISEMINSGDTVSIEKKTLMVKTILLTTGLTTTVVTLFSMVAFYNGELTLEIWLPFKANEDLMHLITAVQVVALLFMPGLLRSNGIQGVVCSLIIYLCDQLEELQDRIRSLHFNAENEVAMRENFKDIVQKHVRLMRYSNTTSLLFKEYFLLQNLSLTMELCLNAVMASVTGSDDKNLLVSFIVFLFVALLNAYLYCYLGNELIIQSGGIALAAYETSWTSWPVDLQKRLLVMIRVAQRTLSLSAGGIAVMSVQTYSQALYNGYSIYAVLNDVVD